MMQKRTRWQKLYVAVSMFLGLSFIFWGLVYLTLVIIGPAPSISHLISHSEFAKIFFVFSLFSIAIIRTFMRNTRRAHFLLPTWMKEPINKYRSETSKGQGERRKDDLYAIITIIVVLLICLLAVALTLTNEAGQFIF